MYLHGRSRKGMPVLWDVIGKVNLARANELNMDLALLTPYYVFFNECIWRVVLDQGENDDDLAQVSVVYAATLSEYRRYKKPVSQTDMLIVQVALGGGWEYFDGNKASRDSMRSNTMSALHGRFWRTGGCPMTDGMRSSCARDAHLPVRLIRLRFNGHAAAPWPTPIPA